MLFCCLWRNVETSCHKHFAVLSRHQQTPTLILPAKCHNLRHSGATASYWQHLAGSSIKSMHWSPILAQNRDFCLPHLHLTPPLWGSRWTTAMPFSTEKLEWCGYPLVKKNDAIVIRFDRTHERDRQTDRHTHTQTDTVWRHRPCLHSMARQKWYKTDQAILTMTDW